ncbi:unannotated protein [freshwater metagenome]|uniref:Unannotated protein n=1 Tax=freshwater metagenome TaxID=449393 RepID=A0A6J7RZA2_9ZZZZ
MIPARIDVTDCSATGNKYPGITLSVIAGKVKCAHVLTSRGKAIFLIRAYVTSVKAPSATPPNATPTGVKNSRPSLMKINEQPQVMPSAMYWAIQELAE